MIHKTYFFSPHITNGILHKLYPETNVWATLQGLYSPSTRFIQCEHNQNERFLFCPQSSFNQTIQHTFRLCSQTMLTALEIWDAAEILLNKRCFIPKQTRVTRLACHWSSVFYAVYQNRSHMTVSILIQYRRLSRKITNSFRLGQPQLNCEGLILDFTHVSSLDSLCKVNTPFFCCC